MCLKGAGTDGIDGLMTGWRWLSGLHVLGDPGLMVCKNR